jgi:hypothetical protein
MDLGGAANYANKTNSVDRKRGPKGVSHKGKKDTKGGRGERLLVRASVPRYALSQELEIRNQEFLGRDERLLVRASRRLPLPEAGKKRATFNL